MERVFIRYNEDMSKIHEELGWCPRCGGVTFHKLKSPPFEPMDIEDIANMIANITLKQSVGEELEPWEKNVLAVTIYASHSMENRYGTFVQEDYIDEP